MNTPTSFLQGNELVLVAEIPKARWGQVQMNQAVMRRFFRLEPETAAEAVLEQVDLDGRYRGEKTRPLVYSASSNKNLKIEFDLGEGPYPEGDLPPLLVVVEIDADARRFRYVSIMPDDPGYDKVRELSLSLWPVGRRPMRRVITNLDEVELRWPDCPLRSPTLGVV